MNTKRLTTKALLMMFALLAIGPFAFADHHGSKGHGMHAKEKMGKGQVKDSMVILSSDSLQTQGMAMVLSNSMAKSGTKVSILLCDAAGDLALKK